MPPIDAGRHRAVRPSAPGRPDDRLAGDAGPWRPSGGPSREGEGATTEPFRCRVARRPAPVAEERPPTPASRPAGGRSALVGSTGTSNEHRGLRGRARDRRLRPLRPSPARVPALAGRRRPLASSSIAPSNRRPSAPAARRACPHRARVARHAFGPPAARTARTDPARQRLRVDPGRLRRGPARGFPAGPRPPGSCPHRRPEPAGRPTAAARRNRKGPIVRSRGPPPAPRRCRRRRPVSPRPEPATGRSPGPSAAVPSSRRRPFAAASARRWSGEPARTGRSARLRGSPKSRGRRWAAAGGRRPLRATRAAPTSARRGSNRAPLASFDGWRTGGSGRNRRASGRIDPRPAVLGSRYRTDTVCPVAIAERALAPGSNWATTRSGRPFDRPVARHPLRGTSSAVERERPATEAALARRGNGRTAPPRSLFDEVVQTEPRADRPNPLRAGAALRDRTRAAFPRGTATNGSARRFDHRGPAPDPDGFAREPAEGIPGPSRRARARRGAGSGPGRPRPR